MVLNIFNQPSHWACRKRRKYSFYFRKRNHLQPLEWPEVTASDRKSPVLQYQASQVGHLRSLAVTRVAARDRKWPLKQVTARLDPEKCSTFFAPAHGKCSTISGPKRMTDVGRKRGGLTRGRRRKNKKTRGKRKRFYTQAIQKEVTRNKTEKLERKGAT